LRFWIILGVFLSVAGTVLFMSGMNSRFGRSLPPVSVAPATVDSTIVAGQVQLTPEISASDARRKADSLLAANAVPPANALIVPDVPAKPKTKAAAVSEEPSRLTVQPKAAPLVDVPPVLDDTDGRKAHLLRVLIEAGWTSEEIEQLTRHLNDPRAHFRHDMLIRNATFKENAEQYAHNLTPEALSRCLTFLDDHAIHLNAAAKREGVKPEVLVSILKVETNLGVFTGKESVFNVYWSLSIGDDPGVQREFLPADPVEKSDARKRMLKRAFWARGQLRDLLYVERHGGEDPVGILGSFAGAFGLAQFIPSSYRAYGRDGDGDGTIDLDNIADAAASIAYYLKENGWQNDASFARKRKVILTYNHSAFYADCVMALVDSISSRRNPPQFP